MRGTRQGQKMRQCRSIAKGEQRKKENVVERVDFVLFFSFLFIFVYMRQKQNCHVGRLVLSGDSAVTRLVLMVIRYDGGGVPVQWRLFVDRGKMCKN